MTRKTNKISSIQIHDKHVGINSVHMIVLITITRKGALTAAPLWKLLLVTVMQSYAGRALYRILDGRPAAIIYTVRIT